MKEKESLMLKEMVVKETMRSISGGVFLYVLYLFFNVFINIIIIIEYEIC